MCADRIGFIGAGQLGEPMVRRLVAAGRAVRVYARREDVRTRLRECGASVADSVADAAAGCEILITCLFSDAQLQQVGAGPGGFLTHVEAGTVVVSHTTGNATALIWMAQARRDIHFVDAPVSGTADDIRRGALTVLLGGSPPAVARARPVLECYADPVIETGALGSALKIKLVNNVLFATNVQLLSAAINLARQLGVESDHLLDALAVCSGGSRASEIARFYGGVHALGESIGPVLRKDVDACAAAALERGADLGLLITVIDSGPLTLSR